MLARGADVRPPKSPVAYSWPLWQLAKLKFCVNGKQRSVRYNHRMNKSHLTELLFPVRRIFNRDLSGAQRFGLFLALLVFFYFLGFLIPADGFFGFDWVNFWDQEIVPPFYPPWTLTVIRFLSWPGLVGLTLAAMAVATLLRSLHPFSAFLAFLSLPVIWTVFLGQLDGIALLGLLALPVLAPLALIKPQITAFAFLARKSYLFVLLAFLLISLLVWGPWPLKMIQVNAFYAEGRYEQDISISPWGIILALPLMWFSRGDIDMLMLSGAFATPHLIFYNLLPVVPAVARLKPVPAGIAAALSWLPLSANWLGPIGWWLGWLFVGWLWTCLYLERHPRQRLADQESAIGNQNSERREYGSQEIAR
jgi:hypothetical protein